MEKKNSAESLRELIYFGSPFNQVNLKSVNHAYYQYSNQDLIQVPISEQQFNTLKYRYPLRYLGPLYEKLTIPCVPALDVPLLTQEVKPTEVNEQNILTLGLIKTSEKTTIKGYKSGQRSSVVKVGDNFYRLKGCGMLDEGFSSMDTKSLDTPKNQSEQKDFKELRGSHYYHLVKRELLIGERVEEIMNQIGRNSGNYSVGYYHYNDDFNKNQPCLQNEYPKIPKFCGVFRTLGEQRLSTHLLQGLDMFIQRLITSSNTKEFNEAFLNAIPKDRLEDFEWISKENEEGQKTITKLKLEIPMIGTTPILFDEIDVFSPEDTLENGLKNGFYQQYQRDQYLDAEKLLPQIFSNLPKDFKYYITLETVKEALSGLDQLLKTEILSILSDFFIVNQESNSVDFIQILKITSQIYCQLGHQIGIIMRSFLEEKFNWAYFYDHDRTAYHCNAHPNNLLVVAENLNKNYLVAPIDFDMSFQGKEFINIDVDDETYGENDPVQFKGFMHFCRSSMLMSLTVEMMLNFSFGTNKDKNTIQTPGSIMGDSIQNLLRDSLCLNYVRGIDGIKPTEIKIQGNQEIHSIIQIALFLTAAEVC